MISQQSKKNWKWSDLQLVDTQPNYFIQWHFYTCHYNINQMESWSSHQLLNFELWNRISRIFSQYMSECISNSALEIDLTVVQMIQLGKASAVTIGTIVLFLPIIEFHW